MLQHDQSNPGLGFATLVPFGLIIAVKAVRTLGLFLGFEYIHIYDLPIPQYLFFVLTIATIIFWILQKPWKGKKALTPQQWLKIGTYALLIGSSYALWTLGLKLYGPVRSVLTTDYGDLSLYYLLGLLAPAARRTLKSNKVNGAVLLLIAYVLFFFDYTPPPKPSVDLSPGERLPDEHEVRMLVFSMHENTFGALCLLGSTALQLLARQPQILRQTAAEIGGQKRLHALAMAMISFACMPAALLSYALVDDVNSRVPWGLSMFGGLILIAIAAVVANYYVDTTSLSKLHGGHVASVSLVSTFVCGLVYQFVHERGHLQWFSIGAFLSPLSWIGLALVVIGMRLLFNAEDPFDNVANTAVSKLPMYATAMMSSARSDITFRGMMHTLRSIVRQIWQNSDSRKIFVFLCANLCFMVVELVYGIWTNSLGLISDACHMMFDSFALAIGLYAAVISKWEPTKTFSYGFGRVQVLSGFVNAVFLMFIAFFILLESLERFLEPEEIKTERLLLVSVLGLLVNLVGLFAFHTHGGHDHSHGGGHSHDEEEAGHHHHHGGEKKKKEKKHDHNHDHEHGHDEHCDHSHDDHHDHSHDHKAKKEKKQKKEKHSHDHHHHGHGDENIMGVYLHVMADTMGSVGVIISSSLVHYMGWTIADPIASFCISIMIFLSAVPLLRSSAHTLLQCTPKFFERDLKDCLARISSMEGVLTYRDVHVWAHASNVLVGTLIVQIRSDASEQKIRAAVSSLFKERGVTHLTVQIECDQVNPVTGLPTSLPYASSPASSSASSVGGFGLASHSSFSKPATMTV